MRRTLTLCAVLGLVFMLPNVGEAAKKKGTINVGDGTVFDATTASGKTVACLEKADGKILMVLRKKKTTEKVGKATLKYKKQLLKFKAKGNTKKLKKVRKSRKEHKQACAAGNGGGGGGGGGGGAGGGGGSQSDPVCSSMAAYDGAVSTADFIYLSRKAGFGPDKRFLDLMDAATGTHGFTSAAYQQVVDEWTTPVLEPTLKTQATELIDGDPNSSGNPTPEGLEMAIFFRNAKTKNAVQARMTITMLALFTQGIETLDQDDYNTWWDWYTYWWDTGLAVDFADALEVVTLDPGMCIYLDNCVSRLGAINENYGRELMELFSLSPSWFDADGNETRNYTDVVPGGSVIGSDVWNASIALTGYTSQGVGTGNLSTVFVDALHDNTTTTLFPGTSNAAQANDLDSVIAAILGHSESSNYYARELLRIYGNPNPTRAAEVALGNALRANNFSLETTFKTFLKSEMFIACGANRGTVIKDPQQIAIEFIKTLQADEAVVDDPTALADVIDRQLQTGLAYANPPTVFWFDDKAFITGGSYLSILNALSNILDTAIANGVYDPSVVITGAQDSTDVINIFGDLISPINAAQAEIFEVYMNTQLINNNEERVVFRPDNSAHVNLKVPTLGLFFQMQPTARQN